MLREKARRAYVLTLENTSLGSARLSELDGDRGR